MRYLSYLTTLLLAVLLASCGGGGGSPGVGSGADQALAVAAPATITLQVGLTQQYSVKGGVKPYTVFSNNPGVAVGWLVGENVFAVGTTAAGAAVVTLQDAKGSKFELAVTAGSTTALFTTAASAISVTPKVPQTYYVGGGTGPYTATSSFPSLVDVKIDGNRLTITGDHIDTANIPNVVVRDRAGATVTIAVSVVTTPLVVTEGEYKVFLGDTVRFFIQGGTPPYRIMDPLNNVVDAKIVNGNEVEVTGTRLVDPVELFIIDAANQVAKGPKITFMAGGDSFLRVSPATLTIPENANSPNIVLNVFGVSAGSPITVFTTNGTLFVPGTPVKTKADGTTYTITLAGGNTCFTPVDNTVPPDGDFTDTALVVGTQPTADIPPQKTITITVLDGTGRSGTSVLTINNTVPGC